MVLDVLTKGFFACGHSSINGGLFNIWGLSLAVVSSLLMQDLTLHVYSLFMEFKLQPLSYYINMFSTGFWVS